MSTQKRKAPRAKVLNAKSDEPNASEIRSPKSFAPTEAIVVKAEQESWQAPTGIGFPSLQPSKPNWLLRIFGSAFALLVSLAIGLAIEGLISDLFARYNWLGWVALAASIFLALVVVIFVVKEVLALRRLANIEHVRLKATQTLDTNIPDDGRAVAKSVLTIYASRPDLAEARAKHSLRFDELLDGKDMVQLTESCFMPTLDARAQKLTSDAARRVAIVTAISPRAIVDIAFVAFESIKLARAIAALYGGRSGLVSSWRLMGAVMSHLVVTGGVAMGDSFIQQLLGQGLAAKLSARLGEGLVNGMMTARVGIAAARVSRPLPYDRQKAPQILDFATELANITKSA